MSRPVWSHVEGWEGVSRFHEDSLPTYNSVFIRRHCGVWQVDSSKNCSSWVWETVPATTREEAMALAEIMWRME